MKAMGIVRAIDRLGRLVIPAEWRSKQGWNEGTLIEMFSDNDGLVLRAYQSDDDNENLIMELQASKNSATDIETQQAYQKVIEHLKGEVVAK